MNACDEGYDHIIRILLDAGADARWSDRDGWTAFMVACLSGQLSTVQLLNNHDIGLLKFVDHEGRTPFFPAILQGHFDIVQFLLDQGVDAHHVNQHGETTLMYACRRDGLEVLRLLLAAGVDVEARDGRQQTALHYAAYRGAIEVLRELIFQHNANMFAVDGDGSTPFDLARWVRSAHAIDNLLEIYGNKLTQDHGSIALHELLKVTEYSFENQAFHPPLNPLQIVLPLGKLTLMHLRTLLHALDPELLRNRDDTGKLPIHIACWTNAPAEVLALILELDPALLHIADCTGALPIHYLCCCSGTPPPTTDYASVRLLVEKGGVGTLAPSINVVLYHCIFCVDPQILHCELFNI